jgi:hypothetical protein
LIKSKAQALNLRVKRWWIDRAIGAQVSRIEDQLQAMQPRPSGPPVLFFTASSRIWHMSLNAAFSLLAAWAVRLAGVETVHAVCQRGMLQCMLGTYVDHPTKPPPCARCIQFSQRLYHRQKMVPLTFPAQRDDLFQADLSGASLDDLIAWSWEGIPIGGLCLPTVQWALRRQNLVDDSSTRHLFKNYIISAVNLYQHFDRLIEDLRPRALVVFNGITYPEAVAREAALQHEIPVVTHEVGLQPFSAFFSHEHATAYPIEVPDQFQLSPAQARRLDQYLNERFRGNFTMAGIKFWPKMEDLPRSLSESIDSFQQSVVVFTNVIFDTSQIHANTIFRDMFAWLDELAKVIKGHPETLFVIRAHPDEDRPGKSSRESVTEWISRSGLLGLPNIYFLGPSDHVSSYELIRRAKFILIYNSSIGLEASIMGSPVLSAGKSRFTQIPIVTFPANREGYLSRLEELLASEQVDVPQEFVRNARRFMYYQLYHASLDLRTFLKTDASVDGGVTFDTSNLSMLDSTSSPELRILADGILKLQDFEYPLVQESL